MAANWSIIGSDWYCPTSTHKAIQLTKIGHANQFLALPINFVPIRMPIKKCLFTYELPIVLAFVYGNLEIIDIIA